MKGVRIGIDDFIGNDTKVPDSKVFKEDKLMAFSNIKVGTIDPRITEQVLERTKEIKAKITKITDLT